MSALQFLNKKSWHTATIKNSEKVWLKEQEAAKEEARVKELQKQIEEERKLEEIQKLEIASGRLKPEDVQRRSQLNWMYQEGHDNKGDEKEKEDVLLGKKNIEIEKLDEQKKKEEKAALIDADTKLREDPLAQIQKEEMQRLNEISRRTGYSLDELKEKKKSLRYTKEEWQEKQKRKEQRKQARAEKRKEKEERRARKRERELRYARNLGVAPIPNTDIADEDRDSNDRKTRRSSDIDEIATNGTLESTTNSYENEHGNYGLRMPVDGTRVAVTKEFVPRLREQNIDSHWADRPKKRRRSRWDCEAEPTRRPEKLGKEECEARLREMQDDARQLQVTRRERLEKYAKEQIEEDTREDSARRSIANEDGSTGFELPTHQIARQALSEGRIGSRARY